MSKVLSPILREYGPNSVMFWCPGCDDAHVVTVGDTHNPGRNWGYNGNPEAPTFTPSILVKSGHYVPGWSADTCYCEPRPNGDDWGFNCVVCHSFVNDGKIQFLGDCTHHLANQTVALPEWPEGK